MLEFLVDIPAYSTKTFSRLTPQAYNELVTATRINLNRAIELMEAYWRTGNIALFDMSLEKLEIAWFNTAALTNEITNEAILGKLRNRATFTYDLAAAMMGATDA